jgi:hypothetical protein
LRDPARYFTGDGVLKSWPSRRSRNAQLAALERLLESFEIGRSYTEPEVNSLLKSRIAFEDHVLVRREMIDSGMLCRSRDCGVYWRPVPNEHQPPVE